MPIESRASSEGVGRGKKRPGCREEEERRQATFEAVIETLAEDYPGTLDYEFRDEDDVFDLLDENDKVVVTISEREMTNILNAVEGVRNEDE